MKILITGASGLLGSNLVCLLKKNNELLLPSSSVFNVVNSNSLFDYFNNNKSIKLCVHCAALTNTQEAEVNALDFINVNIIGTINLLKECISRSIKFVYISTDYVFDGEKGNYATTDPINPIGNYAKTKASAELAVRCFPDALVIRTSFFDKQFPYKNAFCDIFTSKDYVDIIAPKIVDVILSKKNGIVHIGSKRRSVYEIAKTRDKNVIKSFSKDYKIKIPKDTSLICLDKEPKNDDDDKERVGKRR